MSIAAHYLRDTGVEYNQYLKEIKSSLPSEPLENDSEVCNIVLKYEDKTFSRRFKITDKIYVRK